MADGVSAGEFGGILAGSVAVLAAIGKGIGWILNWRDARAQSRAAKLQLWHDELQKREREQDERDRLYAAHIEARLQRQEVEIRVLRRAFELVAEPLRRIEPDSPNLKLAQQMLDRVFPLDPSLPADMAALMRMIDHPAPEPVII